MTDDDKTPWDDKDSFREFNNFEDFMNYFREFLNTPFAQNLMKQIFQNFQHLSKSKKFSNQFPDDFNIEEFTKKLLEGKKGKNPFAQFGPSKKRQKKEDSYTPTSSVYEENGQVTVIVDLSGFSQEEINVDISEEKVRIRGGNTEKRVEKTIDLKERVKPRSVSTNWNNGVLEILLGKKNEELYR